FGNQTVGGTSAAQSVTVTNTGSATLTLSALTLGGTNAADFARSGTCTATTSLAPTQSCTVGITFTPGAAGARTATLQVTSNAATSPDSVSLTGTGVAVPVLSSSATVVGFSAFAVGSTSPAQSVTVTNTGTGTLTLSALILGGTNAGDFAR